jgi:hypothetical protein
MSAKKIILSLSMLCLLTAATAGFRWWKDRPAGMSPVTPPVAEELKKVMQAYQQAAGGPAAITGSISIYDREDNDLLKETKSFCFFRQGASFYTQLSRLQTFCDGDLVVQLDTVDRQIIVQKAAPGQAKMGASLFLDPRWESYFSDTARFRMTGTLTAEGRNRRLLVESELTPELRLSTLVYDTLTYRLDNAEIEWWKKTPLAGGKTNKVWLAKIAYQYVTAFDMDIRKKMRSIVALSKGKVMATDAYRDYQIIANNN